MSTQTIQQSSNGFLIGDYHDLGDHAPDDCLVTIYIEERTPGQRGHKTARRLHHVTCRFVTRNMTASDSSGMFLFWDRDAARWAGEETSTDSYPMRTCTVCGTDTLEKGVMFFNETYAEAKARRTAKAAAEQTAQAERFVREEREAMVRQAERRAIQTVLADHEDEITVLTATYIAEAEAARR